MFFLAVPCSSFPTGDLRSSGASLGVRAGLHLIWGTYSCPEPAGGNTAPARSPAPRGLSPLSFETPKPCSGNAAVPLPSLGPSPEEGAWTGQ